MFKTKRLVYIAILGALSFVLMLVNFPLLPGADFLKIDFSIIPIVVALAVLGLKSAYGVLISRSLLKLLLDNGGITGLIGLPMNIIALGLFVLALAYVWQKEQTCRRLLVAGGLGTVMMTLAMLVLNYVYAVPVYAHFVQFDIGEIIGLNHYLFGMVLPFNILEGVLFTLGIGLVIIPLKPVIDRYRSVL